MKVLACQQQQHRVRCEEKETCLSSSDSEEERERLNMNIENQPPNLSSSSSSSSSKQVVFIGSGGFSPKTLEVDIGAEIEFRLAFNVSSSENHFRLTGASVTTELNFKSPILQREEEFSFTPSVSGELSVSCPIYTAGIICHILVKSPTVSTSSSVGSSSCADKKSQQMSASPQLGIPNKGGLVTNGLYSSTYKDAINNERCDPLCVQLRVESFSFERSGLSIKQGTVVEFIPCSLENDVVLSCGWSHHEDEFDEFEDVVLSKNINGSYSHIFATMGRFKVVNKNFSFMSCIIDVLFDMAYFDTHLSDKDALDGFKTDYLLHPTLEVDIDRVAALVRPHGSDGEPKSSSSTKHNLVERDVPKKLETIASIDNLSKPLSKSELHQAVNISQLSCNLSPSAQSTDVTNLLESMSNTNISLTEKISQSEEEVIGERDIESGGMPTPLSKSQKRKIRKKIGKAKARDRQEEEGNEEEMKPAATLEEARSNVFSIDTKRESEETEVLISELLESSSTFSSPEKAYQDVHTSVHECEEIIMPNNGKNILPSQGAAVLPDWNARSSKYRSFIDPNFRSNTVESEVPMCGSVENVSMETNDDIAQKLEGNKNGSVQKQKKIRNISKDAPGIDAITVTTVDSNPSAFTAVTADVVAVPTTAATQQDTKPVEKKKKKERNKKVGWQMSDSLSTLHSTSETKVLTLEEIEEEELRLDLLKIAELEAEEAKAKEKSIEDAIAAERLVAASKKIEEVNVMTRTCEDIVSEEVSKKKEKVNKEKVTRKEQEKEYEEEKKDAIKDEDLTLSEKVTNESLSPISVDEGISQSVGSSCEANTSREIYLEQDERDLQMAIEESKRLAQEEAEAMKELKRAEARIKEAANARAKAERKIAAVKAKVTKDTQAENTPVNRSTSNNSLLDVSKIVTQTKPLNTAEMLLLERYEVVTEFSEGLNCHDVLPNGKKLPFQIISNTSNRKTTGNMHKKVGGDRKNRYDRDTSDNVSVKNRDNNMSDHHQRQSEPKSKNRLVKTKRDNRTHNCK